jgi:NAD(P)-dependent dehydrogenase (short-subunit alcohol dehydrogenase family)
MLLVAIDHPLRSYVRTWTREFTDRGVRFDTLSPGPIDTPMIDSTADPDATRAQFVAAIPLNGMGRPEEIAPAAWFLASDEASFVAGAELSVDGGMAQVAQLNSMPKPLHLRLSRIVESWDRRVSAATEY